MFCSSDSSIQLAFLHHALFRCSRTSPAQRPRASHLRQGRLVSLWPRGRDQRTSTGKLTLLRRAFAMATATRISPSAFFPSSFAFCLEISKPDASCWCQCSWKYSWISCAEFPVSMSYHLKAHSRARVLMLANGHVFAGLANQVLIESATVRVLGDTLLASDGLSRVERLEDVAMDGWSPANDASHSFSRRPARFHRAFSVPVLHGKRMCFSIVPSDYCIIDTLYSLAQNFAC
ncbi:hypothetical protein C8F01DRAFT_364630 [Mycena amicta]|nr:hypothetical protein C8F01DRAFT_364630 [Mycena amicta]